MIAAGIIYVADLKAGLGGPVLDPVEKAAIDYAVETRGRGEWLSPPPMHR